MSSGQRVDEMKASELIVALQLMVRDSGNLPVVFNFDGDERDVSVVGVLGDVRSRYGDSISVIYLDQDG